MNNYPPSPYPGPNPSSQPGYQPSQPGFPGNFPQSQPGFAPIPPASSQPGFSATQPAYSQPGGFAEAGYAPVPQKKHTLLWVSLVLLLLLAVGGGSYYYFVSRSTPQKTLQEYCTALKNNDAQMFYNTLSTEQQVKTTVSNLQQDLRLLDFVTGGFKNCTVDDNSIQENDPVATATVTFTPNRGPAIHTTVHLIDENGQWRISKNTNLP